MYNQPFLLDWNFDLKNLNVICYKDYVAKNKMKNKLIQFY